MKHIILGLSLMALSTFGMKASTIGYTNGTISRTSVFRMGSTTKQGQAIRFSREKLQTLKGKSISAVNIAVGSRNTTGNNAHIFVATSLEGTPIAEGDLSLSKALQWLTYTLDTPYVITGEETELYVGYTAEIATSYNMLSADFDADIPNCNFAYKDGEWTDTYGIGAGCANITAEIADAPSFCDIIMAHNNLDGYYTAGKDYTLSAKVKNFGTKAVTSFNTDINIDGKTVALKVENVNPRKNCDVRAFTDRWTNVGDVKPYIDIAKATGNTSVYTDRFVEKDDELWLSSLYLQYNVPMTFLKKLHIQKMYLGIGTEDLFRITSAKYERGTSYPFSRSINMSASLTF